MTATKKQLEERVAVLESVLTDVLAENHHVLVGGSAFALQAIRRLHPAVIVEEPPAVLSASAARERTP